MPQNRTRSALTSDFCNDIFFRLTYKNNKYKASIKFLGNYLFTN